MTIPLLVRIILKPATEYAAGALLSLCSAAEGCQREAVAASVLTQLLLVVQSECTERAKRKAHLMLKACICPPNPVTKIPRTKIPRRHYAKPSNLPAKATIGSQGKLETKNVQQKIGRGEGKREGDEKREWFSDQLKPPDHPFSVKPKTGVIQR
ncbi:hypothetical protein RHGRI_026681 [Rhododendron griersonianum]|uniref:U-box domain-containing protein n=1 Tax=Rhododendron griersonianum TaxID=479676 RepID=A0AAV6IZW8_9ERIC|nr:hypothetical protein RHGRI_026681 [Rhododendron griersonianum]